MSDINVGDRIRLISMPNDPDPIKRGATGTVTFVTDNLPESLGGRQIGVDWDNGRGLMLTGGDTFEVTAKADWRCSDCERRTEDPETACSACGCDVYTNWAS